MEIYRLEEDVKLFTVRAQSFPHDIGRAFEKLTGLLGGEEGRRFYGISYQDSGGEIIYEAAVQENYEGEGKALGCTELTLVKGDYLSEYLKDWMQDPTQIGQVFMRLSKAREDTTFPCVECYLQRDVRCMIRIQQ